VTFPGCATSRYLTNTNPDATRTHDRAPDPNRPNLFDTIQQESLTSRVWPV